MGTDAPVSIRGLPPVKYGVTDPQLTGYRRDMTRFDEKCSDCVIAIIWGKWANMAKSARFANKKGEIVKQRCKKDAKAKENRRTSINHPNLGKSGAATSF